MSPPLKPLVEISYAKQERIERRSSVQSELYILDFPSFLRYMHESPELDKTFRK